MIAVHIIGSFGDAVAENIYTLLKSRMPCALVSPCLGIVGDVAAARLLLIETDRFGKMTGGIAIFKGNCGDSAACRPDSSCTAVLQSSNTAAKRVLYGSRCRVVTCGRSMRDTVCISSTGKEGCAVSLQRSIIRCDGSLQEECEIIIELPDGGVESGLFDDFEITASAAILLLADSNSTT